MAFNDAEMAILAQLAYKDVSVPRGETVSLFEFLKKNRNSLRNKLGENYYKSIDNLIAKAEKENYSIIKAQNDKNGTGFAAMAIYDPNENAVTVACRGTEGFNLLSSDDSRRDAATDLEIATQIETDQQKKLEQFMDSLDKDGYDGYYFTGHSLGGNLAAHGAIYMAKRGKVRGVRTYNAPGFNDAYKAKHAVEIGIVSKLFVNYQNEYDYVSSCFEAVGKVEVIKSNDTGWHFGFSHHDVGNLKIDENGDFVRNETGLKSVRTQIVRAVTSIGVNAIWFKTAAMELLITSVKNIPEIIGSIKEWLYKKSTGYRNAVKNPQIVINTNTMNEYVRRLRSVTKRAERLDGRMNNMYWNLGIDWNTLPNFQRLIKANLLLDYSKRLNKCADFLDETARNFASLEREIERQIR